jgi:ketosteroid isomerase-like protein
MRWFGMADDEKDILRILRGHEAAIGRGDAEVAVAHQADDVVIYDIPPPLAYRGGAPAVEGLREWFATWEDGVTVEMKDPQVVTDGDLGVVFGLSRMRGTKKGAGPLDQWSRRTVVLRRHDGEWKVIHEHGSFPMHMDGSGAAATDLTPDSSA